MNRWFAALAVAFVALLLWAQFGGSVAEPSGSFERAEMLLKERFAASRGRVEVAARRLAQLDGADRRRLFREAETIRRDAGVDGVARVDESNVARFWAGRTFDADPRVDFAQAQKGVEHVGVLDLPAHRVLFAAMKAGDGIAVAFLAFDERFPERRSLADEIAEEAGLAEITLRFGRGNVRDVPDDDRPRTTVAIDEGLVQATLVAPSTSERRLEAHADRRKRRSVAILCFFGVALLLAFRRYAAGLAVNTLPRAALLLGCVIVFRVFLFLLPGSGYGTFWGTPADALLTALTALFGAIVVHRAVLRSRAPNRLLAVLGIAACAGAPRLYAYLVVSLVSGASDVALFDPLRVTPAWPAFLLLGALAMAAGVVFLLASATAIWAGRLRLLPFIALAAGFLPWQGPWLAAVSTLAAWALASNATRPEKAAAVTFLAAVAAFPRLYQAERDAFVADVATHAGLLVKRAQGGEAERLLTSAMVALEESGAEREAAQSLAVNSGTQHLAFKLWAAAEWDPTVPCAVQVWNAAGGLVSTFDFDSPPDAWLPEPPKRGDAVRQRFGRDAGEQIQYYVREFELRTVGDDRVLGIARFAVPDRWDMMLLARGRPPLFSEPFDGLGRGTAPPRVVAELAGDGTPQRSSLGSTAALRAPPEAVLNEARENGHASVRRAVLRRESRVVLAAGRYHFAALVFDENRLQRAGFVFAKLLLTSTAFGLLYLLVLLIGARGRVRLLFRHRVGLVLVLLSVPPLLLLATHNRSAAEERYAADADARLQQRLDLAETLLRDRKEPVDDAWCATLAVKHGVDLNVYRDAQLYATSRPGLWETGLLGRRLDADAYIALQLEDRTDFAASGFFGHARSLRSAYRTVRVPFDSEPLVLAAPALEDPQALDRDATRENAFLLAIYLLTAMVTVFASLLLARSLTRPVAELREATARVAGGDLDARLPEGRHDEFGDLVRAFNRMTAELRETQDLRVRAEKAAAWREMARQIAHEIKNPLTPIKLTVQNMLASHREDPAAVAEDFESGAQLILDQIDALKRIADAFSSYARFPSQNPQAVALDALVRDVAALYAANEDATVVVEAPDEPLVVAVDPDDWRRVLINLVTNGLQAGAKIVTLRAARDDGEARLDVVDDGGGIPPEVLERIYEPSFTTKTSGTGLGMPIVKRIVDDRGGTIEIDSTVGRGTRVTIRLPLR